MSVRRVTATLVGVLLLQLWLLQSGTPCLVHGKTAGVAAAAVSHHRMHSAAHSAKAFAGASAQMPTGPCDMAGTSKSCDAPWAPGGCAAAATCAGAPSALVASDLVRSTPTSHPLALLASAMMPLGPAFAPEVPPPRV